MQGILVDRVLIAHNMNGQSLSVTQELSLRLIGSLQARLQKPQGSFENRICCRTDKKEPRTRSANTQQMALSCPVGNHTLEYNNLALRISGEKKFLLGIYPALYFLSSLLRPQVQYSNNFFSNK
jgi:hypothetical protein